MQSKGGVSSLAHTCIKVGNFPFVFRIIYTYFKQKKKKIKYVDSKNCDTTFLIKKTKSIFIVIFSYIEHTQINYGENFIKLRDFIRCGV